MTMDSITEHREQKMAEEVALSPIPKESEHEMAFKVKAADDELEEVQDAMTPDDDDMVMINMDSVDIHKSTESLTLNDLDIDYESTTNRDSNSTQKTSGSTESQRSNKVIRVPALNHIQRFYQFKVREDALSAMMATESGSSAEKVIQRLMASFLDSFYGENANGDEKEKERGSVTANVNVVATSFKSDTAECTVLVVVDVDDQEPHSQTLTASGSRSGCRQKEALHDNQQWIRHFMDFAPIQHIIDPAIMPHFTQLSAQ